MGASASTRWLSCSNLSSLESTTVVSLISTSQPPQEPPHDGASYEPVLATFLNPADCSPLQ